MEGGYCSNLPLVFSKVSGRLVMLRGLSLGGELSLLLVLASGTGDCWLFIELFLGLGAGEGGFVDLLPDDPGLGAGRGLGAVGGGACCIVEFSLCVIWGDVSSGGGFSLGLL